MYLPIKLSMRISFIDVHLKMLCSIKWKGIGDHEW